MQYEEFRDLLLKKSGDEVDKLLRPVWLKACRYDNMMKCNYHENLIDCLFADMDSLIKAHNESLRRAFPFEIMDALTRNKIKIDDNIKE